MPKSLKITNNFSFRFNGGGVRRTPLITHPETIFITIKTMYFPKTPLVTHNSNVPPPYYPPQNEKPLEIPSKENTV